MTFGHIHLFNRSFWCSSVAIPWFPTVREGISVLLGASPPLRSNRQQRPTERLRGGAGVGAAEDFPIKAGIPRPEELVSLSDTFTQEPLAETTTSASFKGILVYGCDWRSNKDVPVRRGAPHNGECVQGKTDCSVVCFPAADRASWRGGGHLLHPFKGHTENVTLPDLTAAWTDLNEAEMRNKKREKAFIPRTAPGELRSLRWPVLVCNWSFPVKC